MAPALQDCLYRFHEGVLASKSRRLGEEVMVTCMVGEEESWVDFPMIFGSLQQLDRCCLALEQGCCKCVRQVGRTACVGLVLDSWHEMVSSDWS